MGATEGSGDNEATTSARLNLPKGNRISMEEAKRLTGLQEVSLDDPIYKSGYLLLTYRSRPSWAEVREEAQSPEGDVPQENTPTEDA